MAQIWEFIKIAFKNITGNKGRSILTMLGIIIGIASVIMVMTVGNGVKQQISAEMDNMGNGQIIIYTEGKEGDIRFTKEDFELIEANVENVRAVTPSLNGYGFAAGSKGDVEARAIGGNTGIFYSSSDPIVAGRYFTEEECNQAKKLGIISESGAKQLFGTTNVLGLSFELSLNGISQDITVVGIRQDSTSSIISGGNSLTIEVPYTVLGNYYQYYIEDFSQFYVIAESNVYSSQVAKKAMTLMENKYAVQGEDMIKMESFADISSQINTSMSMVTLFISFVAAISLLVGGNTCPSSKL